MNFAPIRGNHFDHFLRVRIMIRTFTALLLAASFVASLPAAEPYNPYAKVQEDPPITPDGKINWPPFYKDAAKEARFQGYFATGSCVGTNMNIVNMLKANKVEVNALQTTNVKTIAGAIDLGVIKAVDATGVPVTMVLHPKGVSKLEVSGDMLPELVAPGMIVRFRGTIDNHGQGKSDIEKLEVVSLAKESRLLEVFPDKEQTIFGKIERRENNRIRVATGRGKYKIVSFTLPPSAKVTVTGTTPDLIFAGDIVLAEGKLYMGEGTGTMATVFAEKMTVKKYLPGQLPQEEAKPAEEKVANAP